MMRRAAYTLARERAAFSYLWRGVAAAPLFTPYFRLMDIAAAFFDEFAAHAMRTDDARVPQSHAA